MVSLGNDLDCTTFLGIGEENVLKLWTFDAHIDEVSNEDLELEEHRKKQEVNEEQEDVEQKG